MHGTRHTKLWRVDTRHSEWDVEGLNLNQGFMEWRFRNCEERNGVKRGAVRVDLATELKSSADVLTCVTVDICFDF